MPAVFPPGLTAGTQDRRLAHALAVTVLAASLVIATVALIPALAICPFLSAGHQRLVIRLLASLREWAAVLTESGHPHAGPPTRSPPLS